MKKIILITLFLFFVSQDFFAQATDVKILIKEAKEAYEIKDYDLANTKIESAKKLFKSNPPPLVLALEILSKCEIIKRDPIENYSLITTTKKLAVNYLKNQKAKEDKYYNAVIEEKTILDNYPLDKESLIALKQQKEQEELERRERQIQAEAVAKSKKEKQEAEAKDRMAKEEIARKKSAEEAKKRYENAQIETEKKRLSDIEKERQKQTEREKQNKIYRRRLSSFTNFGVISGEVAKYGLLLETGNEYNTFGFRLAVRSSLTLEEDILANKVNENKTEIDIGTNLKVFKWLYLNIDGGYGYYDYLNRNDFGSGVPSIDKKYYYAANAGITVRLNRIVNISGGTSFIDIVEDFYNPEITVGLTFNFKRRSNY